jgi:hypothetical protein
MSKQYETPAFRELGTLEELTAGTFNKVGTTEDTFTVITNGIVIGSLVASP